MQVMDSSDGPAHRLGGLDALRGLAAFGVVSLHVWMFSWGDAGRPDRQSWELALGELRLGLPFFFVLSGFLLIGPWVGAALGTRTKPRLGSFAIRRFSRVVPAYVAAVIGSIWLLHGTGNQLEPPSGELWRYFAFLQNQDADTSGKLNPPLWSLAVEAMFYVALPIAGLLLVRLRSRRRLIAGLAATVAAALAANHLIGEQQPAWEMSLAGWFGYFALGGLAAVYLQTRARPRSAPRLGWLLLLAGWTLVVANGLWHVSYEGHSEVVARDLPAGAGFALIIAGIATRGARFLDIAPIRGLGVVSYGLYVWHFPVILFLRMGGHWPSALPLAILLVMAVTLTLATLSWYAVERPALRWARARTARARSHPRESTPRRRTAPPRSPQATHPAEARV